MDPTFHLHLRVDRRADRLLLERGSRGVPPRSGGGGAASAAFDSVGVVTRRPATSAGNAAVTQQRIAILVTAHFGWVSWHE